ncbi:MAG TPA: hypothetical protein PKL49_04305 [Steroidobacteraceae bacterium]|nr:hypothetical protein [Steroidobacteraceae bacterium]HNS27607.1 hypothetical protein [Steroidobacteraceae bacterium]
MSTTRTHGSPRGEPAPRAPSPDGQQLQLLLARWQQSLELHARYASLDDEHYQHVQPWPKHERPARWIIDLARQRVDALARLVEQRTREGDRAFIEALEVMGFLANLAGLQGNERFIPLASVEAERRDVLNSTTRTRQAKKADDTTREMPRLATGATRAAASRASAPRASASRAPASRASASRASAPAAPNRSAAPAVRESQDVIDGRIVDDAIRLLGWGRQWHELGELIARLAGRPAAPEVRRILREHRTRIERQQGFATH